MGSSAWRGYDNRRLTLHLCRVPADPNEKLEVSREPAIILLRANQANTDFEEVGYGKVDPTAG